VRTVRAVRLPRHRTPIRSSSSAFHNVGNNVDHAPCRCSDRYAAFTVLQDKTDIPERYATLHCRRVADRRSRSFPTPLPAFFASSDRRRTPSPLWYTESRQSCLLPPPAPFRPRRREGVARDELFSFAGNTSVHQAVNVPPFVTRPRASAPAGSVRIVYGKYRRTTAR